MRKIDTILSLMEPELNKKQLKKLTHVLDTVLQPYHVGVTNEELIDRFLDRCKIKGSSERTITEYGRKLKALSKHVNGCFLDLNTEDIENYISKKKKIDKCEASTINASIGCFRSFFGYLFDYEYISKNPMKKIDSIKEEKKLKEAYTRQEIEKMREYFIHPRDRALIEFLLGCGVRSSEICNIKYKDLDLTTSPCTAIIHGKGNKQRKVPIGDTAVVYLVKYLETRKPMFAEDRIFVSIREPHHPITRSALSQIFIAATKDLGFHAHAHKFRRTYCSELVSHGMALAYAQKLMGHSTPNTTMLYTNVKDNLMFAEFQKASSF